MNNFLEEIDHKIVLAINSWNTPFLDEVMWLVSAKLTWIPLYILLIYLAAKKLPGKQVVIFITITILSVIIADLISNYGFKINVQRYRPSHNLKLKDLLHLYEMKPGEFYRGGLYSFTSSHAANFFAIAIFIGLALKKFYPKLIYILLSIAVLVSFSRLYLGVHYPSDIFIGALIGTLTAILCYRFLYLYFIERLTKKEQNKIVKK